MNRTIFFIIFLAVLATTLGLTRYVLLPKYYPQLLKSNALAASPQPSPIVDTKTDDLLLANAQTSTIAAQLTQKLNPRQKIAQILAVPSVISEKKATSAAELASLFSETPGTFILFGKNITALQSEERVIILRRTPFLPQVTKTLPTLSDEEKKLLQPFIAVDHEGGSVQRLRGEGFTTIPSAADQCQMNAEQLQPLIERAAKELFGSGIDVVFAPEIDIGEKNPALRTRICSPDHDKVEEFAQRWIVALQKNNVIPVVKHYPGIGQTKVDLHQKAEAIEFNPIEHSLFISLLKKYPGVGVMTTHVGLKVGDTVSKPCTVSSECLQRLQLDNNTLRFTDGIEMGGAQGVVASRSAQVKQTMSEVALQAIQAGHTVVVLGQSTPPEEVDKVITQLADEYQRSPEFKKRVDEAVEMILSAKAAHWSVDK